MRLLNGERIAADDDPEALRQAKLFQQFAGIEFLLVGAYRQPPFAGGKLIQRFDEAGQGARQARQISR